MQPPFAQRQWEETVDKMAKNYGAQMDVDQRKSIIGYLVATHGPDSVIDSPIARDEDFDSTPPAQLPPPAETAPTLQFATAANEQAAEVKRGADLFKQDCAGCHGESGRGDGEVAQVLWRKPKNLAGTLFSRQLLGNILWNGKRGTAMPAWRGLPQSDRVALAAYVQKLHAPIESERVSAETLRLGSNVFLQNCAPCHGESGDGQGATAAALLPKPANFKLKQPDPDYVLQVLNDGIPGTAMPSWKDQISVAHREALASFVRSLFEGPELNRP